jgi:site-specific DNA-methyltransferase (adenine-specific)
VHKNQLYYGDNLTVLREHIKDESVDLLYLDPPFNSRQDYNFLFAEKDGTRSGSQIMAFEDTWEWNLDAEAAYEEIVLRGGRVSEAMRAFRTSLGHSDMMAYLAMMAPRLIELHRVLKVIGSAFQFRVRCCIESDEGKTHARKASAHSCSPETRNKKFHRSVLERTS